MRVGNNVSVRVSIRESITLVRRVPLARILRIRVLWTCSSPTVAQMAMLPRAFLAQILDDIEPFHAVLGLLDQLLMRLWLMTLGPDILVNFPIRRVDPLFEVALVDVVCPFGDEILPEAVFDHFLTFEVLGMDGLFELY